jgi:beta-alanine--pyruvate transaminase
MEHVNSIITRSKDRGLLVKTMGAALEIAPPLIIKKEHIDQTIEILDQCISEEEHEMGI